MVNDLRDVQLKSLNGLAAPLRGLRVLLWGFSGAGFPGGDGVAEALDVLPSVGVCCVHSHQNDPAVEYKLDCDYDVTIVCNTRVGEVLKAPPRLWETADCRAYWFWDLRPGSVGAPLRGKVDHVFLSYNGPWISPENTVYEPAQWAEALGCPVGYCPQAGPLRTPQPAPGGPRVLFVGDLANRTYHRGRAELCRALGASVRNARDRAGRLAVEAQLTRLYPSARYCLSSSPLAPGYTSVRTYSILACGGLLLLQRFSGADRLFRDLNGVRTDNRNEDGNHAVIFDGAADLIPRLAALDANVAERERIANNGRRLHAQKHTLAHHILSICRQVKGISPGFSGWL
jgi:hypothetical protein